MSEAVFHPEEVRAILRMRYGTIEAFATGKGLNGQAVRDFLRGRTSKPVARQVARELGVPEDHLRLSRSSHNSSTNRDNSNATARHSLIAEAK